MGKKISLAVLLALVIAAVILQNLYVHSATKELLNDLEELSAAFSKDDILSARAAAAEFLNNWEKHKEAFEAFFEHKEVDSISSTARAIQSLCDSGSKEDALAHIAAEKFYIEHIREIDTLGWENVF